MRAAWRCGPLVALLILSVASPVSVTAKGSQAGTWSKAPKLLSERIAHSATLLTDGRVLLTGGFNVRGDATAMAELFDPKTNRWVTAASMTMPRAAHTATLLSDGNVLVAGGETANNNFPTLLTATAEIYHPANNSWTSVAPMDVARWGHDAVRLHDGRVLLVGGFIRARAGAPTPTPPPDPVLEQAEVYDPAGNTWTPVGNGLPFLTEQATTLMPDGTVLVTGGAPDGGAVTGEAELFDPTANRWHAANWPLATPRYGHTSTLMIDGRVFLTGGYTTVGQNADANTIPARNFLMTSEIFDVRGNTATGIGPSDIPRFEHTATLLDNGMILVVGSAYASNADSQLFDPGSPMRWISTGMPMDRYLHTATRLVDGRVLVAGGYGVGSANTAWLFSSQSVVSSTSYSPTTGLLIAAFIALILVGGLIVLATSPRWRGRTKPATPGPDTEWIDP